MKIQEQIVNNEHGTSFWNVYFQTTTLKPLDIETHMIIQKVIENMIEQLTAISNDNP